jgi:hypothetical protein
MDGTNLFISNFEISDARRLFVKILLFIPLLLMVVAVNILIDPAGLYRKMVHKYEQLEYHTAQALVKGENIRFVWRDIDDRLLQKYFIENMTSAPDIVILGSSHSMWLGDNIFLHKKVINNSVLRAALADYLGIFDGYVKKNLYPKRVVCLLDAQLIGSPMLSEGWLSIKDDTYDMLGRLGVHSEKIKPPVIRQAWLNAFSFSYFQESMKQLRYKHSPRTNPSKELLFKDGRRSLGFFSVYTEKNRAELVREFFYEKNGKMLNQMKPDKELEGILEAFIRYLMERHIQVTLCLLPFHPDVYESFFEPQKRSGGLDIVGVENYYRGLAQRLNLEIIGSYDPAVCNLEGKDFYDGDHIRDDAIERMFKQKGPDVQ